MDSFSEDRYTKNTSIASPNFDKREKFSCGEFENRERCCARSLTRVANLEHHPETTSQSSSKQISKNKHFPANISICINERFNNDPSNHVNGVGEYLRRHASFIESQCTNESDRTVRYTEQPQQKLADVSSGAKIEYFKALTSSKTGCSSLQTCLQTENSALQTGYPALQGLESCNPSLKTGNSSLQNGNSGLGAVSSSLQAGDNGSSGPCEHSALTPKKSISDDGLCCRICHSVTDLETLVSPCLCTGSMKYVHESCLLNWLKSSVKTNCELCLHEVPVKKLVKPLREWRFLDEKPVAIIWLVSFLILLTLNILSVVKDASRGCTSTTCVVFYVLGCTGAILGVIFLWFWAKKSAVYFTKLLTLNQVWLLDEKYSSKAGKNQQLVV